MLDQDDWGKNGGKILGSFSLPQVLRTILFFCWFCWCNLWALKSEAEQLCSLHPLFFIFIPVLFFQQIILCKFLYPINYKAAFEKTFSSLISRAYQSFDSLWTNVFKQRITSSWLMMSSKVSAPQLWCGNGRCYYMFLVWWKQVIEMSSALCGGLAPLTVLCVCPVLGWWWIQLTLFSWGLAASQNVLNHWLVAAWPSSLCPSGTIRDFQVSLKKFLLDLINSYRTRVK